MKSRPATMVILFSCLFTTSCTKRTIYITANDLYQTHGEVATDLYVQGILPPAEGNSRSGVVSNDMVMYWNEKSALVLNAHTNPGADARFFAIIQIAVHDALNGVKPKYSSYALNIRDKDADPNAAVASAAYWSIRGLNKQGVFPLDSWYNESLASIPDGESKQRGIQLGKTSAETVIANRSNDGFRLVVLTSLLPADGNGPGKYRSTLPFSNPLLNLPHLRFVPNWGAVVRPFVTQSNYQFRPPGPHPVHSYEYTIDYFEVKNKGGMSAPTRNAEEEQLSRFWSDLRQHIVWNNFTREVIKTKRENLDAWKTARIFALVHTAMADGASAMFESIYHYYHWRPETAIRIEDDGNIETVSDPSWLPGIIAGPNVNPLFNNYTPNVPEYPSTFAIAGSITGQILDSIFGSDEISIQAKSEKLPGISLSYSSISKAVQDNAYSKIYSGWTFRKSATDGIEMGKQISGYVLTHAFSERSE